MQPCPWSPAELLPHRPPMLLLDDILGYDDAHVRAVLTIHPASAFLEAEGVPSIVGVEYIAQACAAWSGLQARLVGRAPRLGFLLGARGLRLHRPWFRRGERLLVSVALAYRDAQLASFQGSITVGEAIAVESDLTVYEPGEGEELPG